MRLIDLTAKQREYLIRLCHGLETWRPVNNAVMQALQRRGLADYAVIGVQRGQERLGWQPTASGKTLAAGA